eukprot:5095457-Amphidinium_carterae.1
MKGEGKGQWNKGKGKGKDKGGKKGDNNYSNCNSKGSGKDKGKQPIICYPYGRPGHTSTQCSQNANGDAKDSHIITMAKVINNNNNLATNLNNNTTVVAKAKELERFVQWIML